MLSVMLSTGCQQAAKGKNIFCPKSHGHGFEFFESDTTRVRDVRYRKLRGPHYSPSLGHGAQVVGSLVVWHLPPRSSDGGWDATQNRLYAAGLIGAPIVQHVVPPSKAMQ